MTPLPTYPFLQEQPKLPEIIKPWSATFEQKFLNLNKPALDNLGQKSENVRDKASCQ